MIPLTGAADGFIAMATRRGLIKKTALEEFANIRKVGKIAIKINEGDELISVQFTTGKDELIIASREGKCIRFSEEDVRPMGRDTQGVRAMALGEEDCPRRYAGRQAGLQDPHGHVQRLRQALGRGRLPPAGARRQGHQGGRVHRKDGLSRQPQGGRRRRRRHDHFGQRHHHPPARRRHLAHRPQHAGRAHHAPERREGRDRRRRPERGRGGEGGRRGRSSRAGRSGRAPPRRARSRAIRRNDRLRGRPRPAARLRPAAAVGTAVFGKDRTKIPPRRLRCGAVRLLLRPVRSGGLFFRAARPSGKAVRFAGPLFGKAARSVRRLARRAVTSASGP